MHLNGLRWYVFSSQKICFPDPRRGAGQVRTNALGDGRAEHAPCAPAASATPLASVPMPFATHDSCVVLSAVIEARVLVRVGLESVVLRAAGRMFRDPKGR